MEKYGTFVVFKAKDDPGKVINIPLDDTQVIDEMEKSGEWIRSENEDGISQD